MKGETMKGTNEILRGHYGRALVGPRTDDWTEAQWRAMFADRMHGDAPWVGASTVSAILGRNPYRSAWDVWASVHAPDVVEPFHGNIATEIGNALEPVIIAATAERLDTYIHKGTHILFHPDAAHVGCNLDGWAPDLGVPVECKSIGTRHGRAVREFAETGLPRPGSYLESYYVQVQAQIAITGAPYGYLAMLVDRDLYLAMIRPDHSLMHTIEIEIPAWVRRHLLDGVEPTPTGATDLDALKRLHAPTREAVELGSLHADMIARRRVLKDTIKQLNAEVTAIDAELIQASHGASKIIAGDHKLTRVTSERTRIDSKRLKAERPDIAAEYSSTYTVDYLRG